MIRRIVTVLVIISAYAMQSTPVVASPAPKVAASAAVLLDYASGRIVYQKNAFAVRPPASLTKIMTALVALETGDSEARITVSSKAHSVPGAAFNMAVGDKPPLWKLVYGMLLRSGNDAAVAVAEGVGGSEPAFVKMMNDKAAQLGLTSTNFANPHGLTAPGHQSSARDIAVLARVALQNPQFAKVVSTREAHMTWNGKPRVVTNINRILWRLDGADGVKTGYTDPAGYCLAASATAKEARGQGPSVKSYKPGERLVVVILGSPSSEQRYRDAESLLTWGLEGAQGGDSRYTVQAGDTLSTVAARFHVRLSALMSANGVRDADSIRAGQKLIIPTVE